MREALLGVLARKVDELRFGLRDCSLGELADLVDVWADLNSGDTPAEAMMRALGADRD